MKSKLYGLNLAQQKGRYDAPGQPGWCQQSAFKHSKVCHVTLLFQFEEEQLKASYTGGE
jgi:hypothetical protein